MIAMLARFPYDEDGDSVPSYMNPQKVLFLTIILVAALGGLYPLIFQRYGTVLGELFGFASEGFVVLAGLSQPSELLSPHTLPVVLSRMAFHGFAFGSIASLWFFVTRDNTVDLRNGVTFGWCIAYLFLVFGYFPVENLHDILFA